MNWFKKSAENIEDLEYMHEVFPAMDTYTRYVWGTKEEIQPQLANGLQMNTHGELPTGWFGTHTGGDEWVGILAHDYDRTGPVCEITIFDLPEGYYIIEDPDLSIKGKVDSWMIVSRNSAIPPQCLEITREFNTEDVESDYGDGYWEMG